MACEESKPIRGIFGGFSVKERRDYPNGVFQVTFWLKPEVPFAKLVRLDAALQGLHDFEGYRLKGYIFYPDVRLMAKGSGESFNEPWPVFAKALSKHPLAKVDVIVEEKGDAETLTKALEPFVRRISTFNRTGLRPGWIDPAVETRRMRKEVAVGGG